MILHIIFRLLVSGVFFQQVVMQARRLEQICANYNEAQYLFMNVIWASQYPIVIRSKLFKFISEELVKHVSEHNRISKIFVSLKIMF